MVTRTAAAAGLGVSTPEWFGIVAAVDGPLAWPGKTANTAARSLRK